MEPISEEVIARWGLGRREKLSAAQEQRGVGVCLGAAVGDGLGAPFEFKQRGAYRKRFPTDVIGGTGEMIGGGSFNWEPGEFTDDTQMAIALAKAVLSKGGYDPDTVWEWFKTWSQTARDIGVNTRQALSFTDWRHQPGLGNSAGNGALMRAFPLSLAYLQESDDVAREVVLHQASLTHRDPAAGWGAWIAVAMMRRGIMGEDPLVALDEIFASLPADVQARFELLYTWTQDHSGASNGEVATCLAQAVWALRSTDNFADAVIAAVNLGEDADTVGCVAGALAGARYGVPSIPSRWMTYVHGVCGTPEGEIVVDNAALQALALSLLGRELSGEQPPEEARGPSEVAPGVFAANLAGAVASDPSWAVVSGCRMGDLVADHLVRRQLYLIDREHVNDDLPSVLRDVVASIDAFLDEGRNVVVHCHGGRSRTGLMLKAWAMNKYGLDERGAHEWLLQRWDLYEDYNKSFVAALEDEGWRC